MYETNIIGKLLELLKSGSDLLDLISNYDILLQVAQGKSNKTIALSTDLSIEDIDKIVKKYYNFSGFSEDLDFNPRAIFKRTKSADEFAYESTLISAVSSPNIISTAYDICKIFSEIERRLDKEWE